MASEREEVEPVECDCCGGTWGDINADGEHDNVWTCVHELTQQRDTMRRERDEARRERDEWRDKWAVSAEFNAVHQNRAERAERVVNMLRVASALPSPDLLTYGDWADLCDAVRALDAAEGKA